MSGYLLDTHALVWWTLDSDRLPIAARDAIIEPDNRVYLSVASIWELAIKYGLGKMPEAEILVADLKAGIAVPEFIELAISRNHTIASGEMQIDHRDPFDRLLIAQAQAEELVLISNEKLFDNFGVERIWDR